MEKCLMPMVRKQTQGHVVVWLLIKAEGKRTSWRVFVVVFELVHLLVIVQDTVI